MNDASQPRNPRQKHPPTISNCSFFHPKNCPNSWDKDACGENLRVTSVFLEVSVKNTNKMEDFTRPLHCPVLVVLVPDWSEVQKRCQEFHGLCTQIHMICMPGVTELVGQLKSSHPADATLAPPILQIRGSSAQSVETWRR